MSLGQILRTRRRKLDAADANPTSCKRNKRRQTGIQDALNRSEINSEDVEAYETHTAKTHEACGNGYEFMSDGATAQLSNAESCGSVATEIAGGQIRGENVEPEAPRHACNWVPEIEVQHKESDGEYACRKAIRQDMNANMKIPDAMLDHDPYLPPMPHHSPTLEIPTPSLQAARNLESPRPEPSLSFLDVFGVADSSPYFLDIFGVANSEGMSC